jgi:ABC-type sugar transport system substrate-binding protein
MRKRGYLLAALAAVGLVAAACSDDDDGGATTEATAGVTAGDTTAATEPSGTESTDTVDVSQGQDVNLYVITHGDDGVFWSVVQKAVEQAGADLGINVTYQGANNNADRDHRRRRRG